MTDAFLQCALESEDIIGHRQDDAFRCRDFFLLMGRITIMGLDFTTENDDLKWNTESSLITRFAQAAILVGGDATDEQLF